jgi:YgiT-type zinc finger domain-containing protein
MKSALKEAMVDTRVTYTLEHDGKAFIVENVPARVCKETGEQYFAPETVEHIQAIIKSRKRPDRVIETPVYEYA